MNDLKNRKINTRNYVKKIRRRLQLRGIQFTIEKENEIKIYFPNTGLNIITTETPLIYAYKEYSLSDEADKERIQRAVNNLNDVTMPGSFDFDDDTLTISCWIANPKPGAIFKTFKTGNWILDLMTAQMQKEYEHLEALDKLAMSMQTKAKS